MTYQERIQEARVGKPWMLRIMKGYPASTAASKMGEKNEEVTPGANKRESWGNPESHPR